MSNKVRGMPREVVNVLRMNVLHRVPVLWLCLALLLLALVPSVPAHAGFVGCVLAKRSGDEAVQLKLTTDEDGEVRITIGNNVITFGVKAYEQLDTGLLEISGDVVDLELFYDDMLADRCRIHVWDIPDHYEGFCCDEIPPVIEAVSQPKPNAKGWNNELVTVCMTAEDEEGGSGIAAIYYIHDGEVIRIGEDALGFAEAGRIATYSFDLAEDGTYELEFWAEDNAGNESEHGTLTVEIDKTPPLIEASRSPSPNENGWNNTAVTVSFHCSDSLSGIASCASTQQITREGKGQSVTGVAVDKADNRAETSVENINIDKTDPSVSVSPYSPSIMKGETIRLTIEASDSGSGIASVTANDSASGRISLGHDGNRWTGSLQPTQDGRITITVMDRAGNVTPRSVSYTVHDLAKFDVRNLSVTLEAPSHEGTKATIHCTIKNTGGRSDTQSIRLFVDGNQKKSQQLTLAPGKSQNLSFSYVFSHAGEYSVKVKSDDDSESKAVTVLTLPKLEVSRHAIDFGEIDIDSSASRSFTITNRGGSKLEGRIRCSSGNCAAFSFSPSSFSLGKQETSRITVRFSPNQEKTYRAVIGIDSNGGDASIQLVGEGKTDVQMVCPRIPQSPPTSQTHVPETPRAYVGGTLTIGVSWMFVVLDPRDATEFPDMFVIGEMFDALISLDPETLALRPFIAKSWEVSEDCTAITFYLNEGIRFHNGEDLTAEDVVFTFNWIADPENASPNQSELIGMKEAVVVDDYTVEFVLEPEGMISMSAMAFTTPICPKDTVLAMGDAEFNLNPIGSGPYKFVEWKAGDHIILERNEDYWLVYPNLDQVIYRPIPELSVMMLELEAGGIDIADNMPTQEIPRFREDLNVDVRQCPSLSYYYLFFNMSSPPSNDIRYREAVYMSVDMDAAVFCIFEGLTSIRAYGCIPPRLWAADVDYLRDQIALWEDDAEAKRLFAELKAEGVIPAGYTTTIYCPPDPRRMGLATILAANLEENGLNAKATSLDWGSYLDMVYRSEADPLGKDFDQGILAWGGGPDPHDFLYYLFHSDNATVGSANNLAFYKNPEVDELIFTADTTFDQATREALYIETQRICFEDYVHIPLYHVLETKGVRQRVKGFTIDPLGNLYLCDPYRNVWVEG